MTNKSYEILSGETLVAVWQDSKLTVVNEALLPLYLKKIQNADLWLETRAIDSHRANSRLLKKALRLVGNRQIGVIELEEHLDIDLVTDIFIRINSKGTALSQGDFVMSKIAADEKYGGNMLRKAIDYFSHLTVEPSFFDFLKEHDDEFVASSFFNKISWLKDDKETVFDPECDDIIRIAFMHKFGRAIPAYAFIREGNKEMAKKLLNQIGCSGFIF